MTSTSTVKAALKSQAKTAWTAEEVQEHRKTWDYLRWPKGIKRYFASKCPLNLPASAFALFQYQEHQFWLFRVEKDGTGKISRWVYPHPRKDPDWTYPGKYIEGHCVSIPLSDYKGWRDGFEKLFQASKVAYNDAPSDIIVHHLEYGTRRPDGYYPHNVLFRAIKRGRSSRVYLAASFTRAVNGNKWLPTGRGFYFSDRTVHLAEAAVKELMSRMLQQIRANWRKAYVAKKKADERQLKRLANSLKNKQEPQLPKDGEDTKL